MPVLDIDEIKKILPHRYPFLLVDRILELDPGKRAIGIKNVTANEPFFQGHFPQRAVMPGVLIIEAMAQAAAILSFMTVGTKADANSVYYFVGIDNARFKRPVGAGDQLVLHVTLLRQLRGIWKFSAEARVDGALASSADLMCTMRDVSSIIGA